MADKSQQTEQATPKRLEKARREGNFPTAKQFVSAAQFTVSRPENVVQWNINVPSFSVYRGGTTESRAPREGEMAITRADRLGPEDKVDVLYEEAGVVIVRTASP